MSAVHQERTCGTVLANVLVLSRGMEQFDRLKSRKRPKARN